MLKTQPLCPSNESNLRERVLGEVEKNGLAGFSSTCQASHPGPASLMLPCGFQREV